MRRERSPKSIGHSLPCSPLSSACGDHDPGMRVGKGPERSHRIRCHPAADSIGEALFLDTRFSEYFAANMTSVNAPLATGDPVVDAGANPERPAARPLRGAVDQLPFVPFRNRIPGRQRRRQPHLCGFHHPQPNPPPTQPNGFDHTPRNAMQMVDSFTSRSGPLFLHFDGEFASGEDLVIGTMTGRNFGWMPSQYNEAIAHIAKVIREDDGSGQLAADRLDGLSYSVIFKGTDPRITPDILLPPSQRLDVATATDIQVVNEVAMCIAPIHEGPPLSARLLRPLHRLAVRQFSARQSPAAGAAGGPDEGSLQPQRSISRCSRCRIPIYITAADGCYKYHAQPYQFGATELQRLEDLSRLGDLRRDERPRRQLRRLPSGAGLLRLRLP